MFYPDALPAILGCDGAGTAIETGTGVTRFQAGDNVWFCHGGLGGAPGNYTEITVLEESAAERIPPMPGFEEAAALPLVLITAREALFDRTGLTAGQTGWSRRVPGNTAIVRERWSGTADNAWCLALLFFESFSQDIQLIGQLLETVIFTQLYPTAVKPVLQRLHLAHDGEHRADHTVGIHRGNYHHQNHIDSK